MIFGSRNTLNKKGRESKVEIEKKKRETTLVEDVVTLSATSLRFDPFQPLISRVKFQLSLTHLVE